ncbi:hypothetical protein [Acidihalobacter ferrooxydans]|uniref:Uncharacterized protein n=1 Tax=Acidihalobacter ferrooxydans TaxID=1765967 RepID=A0A1P8UG80_9GAMM|nr:hypothetical protein [Acidihalobacter ferrooxydans]APZ42846.1 hypothetical protein BW247_06850 [Acidihalobacter ferrooxydans]
MVYLRVVQWMTRGVAACCERPAPSMTVPRQVVRVIDTDAACLAGNDINHGRFRYSGALPVMRLAPELRDPFAAAGVADDWLWIGRGSTGRKTGLPATRFARIVANPSSS